MDNQEILSNIRKILRGINLESKRIQKSHGVSIPQLLCLNHLQNSENFQSSVKTLSGELNLNSSTVSGIVKRLEAKSLIAKLPNPRDGRSAIIALTEQGAKLISETPTLLQDRLGENLEKLTHSERENVHKSLELLVQLLGIESIDASPILVSQDHLSKDHSEDGD